MRIRELVAISALLAALALPVVAAAQSAPDTYGTGDHATHTKAPDCLTPTLTSPPQTIVGVWNCALLVEVRLSGALRNGPPVVARALAIAHTCMYDAWAAYDRRAVGTVLGDSLRRPKEERTDANKAKAISFAAYRCLTNLYPGAASIARLGAVLTGQGYILADATTPATIGNTAGQAVIDARRHDGSNQYGDQTPAPCVPQAYPWTPLTLNQLGDAPPALQPLPCVAPGVAPGGAPTGPYADYDDVADGYQHYIPSNPLMGFCSPLLAICPASDDFIDPLLPWPNVADPSHWQPLVFSSHARQTFVAPHWNRVTPFALTSASQFDDVIPPPNYTRSPGRYRRDVEEMIEFSADLDDARKLIVEYWADGPESEFPPGHWALFAQFVSRRDRHTIDDDAKMFFAMHNASFDAGIVGWHTKRKYDGVRPITAVRHLKQGKTIRAWGGPGRPTEDIPGEQWMPYNPGTNLTPPFPGYFSGHSVFSRSSATVLKLFTGSDDFGFSTLIPAGFGRVEPGIPAVDTIVSFETFGDAADAAGLSRLYGGIHFSDDNTVAQAVGLLIGKQAWDKAKTYFEGTEDED